MASGALIVHFEDETAAAQRLANASRCPLRCVERHCFPDGELRLRLPEPLPRLVVIYRGLQYPNEKLVELMLAADTARAMGAEQVVLVTPYLAYMRQDIAFRTGEAISQQVVGRFLGNLFDAVMTVDPHLHRIQHLSEAVPLGERAIALSAAPLLGEFISRRRPGALLVGPDAESAQWVASAAATHGFDHAVCAKIRHGDRDVEIALPKLAIEGRQVVLVDDVASTGHTVAVAAQLLLQAGAQSVDLAVTHALFAEGALSLVREAGVGEVWSTDAITHSTNSMSLAPLLAEALLPLLAC